MARASRTDVARIAGVSLATVSHVMNGRSEELGFSPETAKRVREAAAQVGYIPRASARAFRLQQTKVIAFFFTEVPTSLHLPVFNELLVGAISEAQLRNLFILPVLLPNSDPIAAEKVVMDTMRNIELFGAICETGTQLQTMKEFLRKTGLPVCWLDRSSIAAPDPNFATVGIAEDAGVQSLLNQIDLHDVSKPVCLKGPGIMTARFDPLLTHFPGAEVIETDSWLANSGYQAMQKTFTNSCIPDLVLAGSARLALGARDAIRDAGYHLPDTIQLFAYGDSFAGDADSQSISAVHWPLEQLSVEAVRTICDLRDNPTHPRCVNLPSVAQVRGTTRLAH